MPIRSQNWQRNRPVWVRLVALVLPALIASAVLGLVVVRQAVQQSAAAARVLTTIRSLPDYQAVYREIAGEASLIAATQSSEISRRFPAAPLLLRPYVEQTRAANTKMVDALIAAQPTVALWPEIRRGLQRARAAATGATTPQAIRSAYAAVSGRAATELARLYADLNEGTAAAGAPARVVQHVADLQVINQLRTDEFELGWAVTYAVSAPPRLRALHAGAIETYATIVEQDAATLAALRVEPAFSQAFKLIGSTATDLSRLTREVAAARAGKLDNAATLINLGTKSPLFVANTKRADAAVIEAMADSIGRLKSKADVTTWGTITLVLALLAASFAFSYRLYGRIRAPLQRLSHRAEQISLGILEPGDERGIAEIAGVSDSLNQAVASLEQLRSQAEALAHGDLTHPSLSQRAAGRLGEVFHRSVSQVVELQQQLQHEANHDHLTGLLNRRAVRSHLDELIDADHPSLGVVLLDLDGFKQVNDDLGHATGDRVVQVVADRLTRLCPPDTVACRLGGDEFLLIMPACDPPALEALATRVLASIERPIDLDGLEVVVSASIGLATWSDEDRDGDGLIDRADAAAYRAKADGKARVFSADSAMMVGVPVDA